MHKVRHHPKSNSQNKNVFIVSLLSNMNERTAVPSLKFFTFSKEMLKRLDELIRLQ